MIATGTGLAPYMSMLSTHLMCGGPRRSRCSARRAPFVGPGLPVATDDASTPVRQLHLLPVISRPQREPAPWVGSTGYVQDLWKDGAIEQAWGFRPTPENTHVFLCGAPAMIDEAEAMLQGEGFKEHSKKRRGRFTWSGIGRLVKMGSGRLGKLGNK